MKTYKGYGHGTFVWGKTSQHVQDLIQFINGLGKDEL